MQVVKKKGRFLSCTSRGSSIKSNNFPCQFCQLNTDNPVAYGGMENLSSKSPS